MLSTEHQIVRLIKNIHQHQAAFSPQRPEFEIVGAFATDPLNITNIESGDGATPGQVVTVTTSG